MTMPAENRSDEFETEEELAVQTSHTPDLTADVEVQDEARPAEETERETFEDDPELASLIHKVSERPTRHLGLYAERRPSMFSALFQMIGSSTLLRSDLFLSILALTLLNALIFIHYSRSEQHAYDLKSANAIIKKDLSKDADFLDPIIDIINYHGEFKVQTNNEFSISISRLRAKLSKLGLNADEMFFQDEFLQKNGGLYWNRKGTRPPTHYQPSLPTFPLEK